MDYMEKLLRDKMAQIEEERAKLEEKNAELTRRILELEETLDDAQKQRADLTAPLRGWVNPMHGELDQ